ncbi:MAG: hypothetical protein E4H14_06740 [Candidatus Thorarchaeota archaeon]|nr:MAG: hypothetical protein E4H14_06740 [Candidatus Thorarchaeota archaeon]
MPAVVRIGDPISCGDTMAQGSGNTFANGIPVSRKGIDLTAGHCYPPIPIIFASPNVFVNNIAVDRVRDPIAVHCCGNSCHSGVAFNGSPNVFANDPGGPPASVTVVVEQYVQPGVNKLFASQVMADDPQTGPQLLEYRRIQETAAGITPQDPVFVEEAPPTTTKPAEVPADCSDIEAHQGKFPGSFPLSTNFVLSQITTNTLVSNYPLRSNQGLTEKQLVCNLRILCVNVLEPMLAKYGSTLTINSGFRYDSWGQHGKGQAVDVSFKDLTKEKQWWDRAVDIKESFVYDQFIYEAERSVWYHLSYSSAGNRRQTLTKARRSEKYHVGIQRIITQA